jgi:glycosyltransferase involved in cell wall biosynthesis
MKLLIVSDAWHPQVNGVVRTYEYLQEELERMGHDVHIIGPSDFPSSIPMPGYSEIKLVITPYKTLKQHIESYQPDYIHVATEGPLGWATRRYCRKNNIDYTTAYHTQFPDYVAKRAAKHLKFLYSPAHHLAKQYIKTFHAHSKYVYVATPSLENQLRSWGFDMPFCRLSRGANLDIFYPDEKTLFHDLKKPVALYVGRVAIEKNIEAFLSMPWEGSKVVVGNGPSMNELKGKYPEAHFLGTKMGKDLAAHYRSADVFVFPSRTDTFGIVILEALACGLPVAGYNVTGPKDIITEQFLGALDEENLSRAAYKALENGTAEQRSTFVKKHYTWENMARQFLSCVNNLSIPLKK